MKVKKIIFLLFTLMMPLSLALCQEQVEFKGSATQVVETGEYFRLSYSLNQKGEGFVGPEIKDFTFSGPMLSTSMSTQIINGKVSQTATYTYVYTLQATAEGKFTLPPAQVQVNGKTYQSNSVTIEVIKANTSGAQQQSQQTRQVQQPKSAGRQITDEDLFVRINLDKTNVYKGEQILATIKVYTRVNLSRFGDISIPSYKGFWTQEIKIPDQISLVRENYEGRAYNVGTIKKSILVPQQTGEIKIDPFELECFITIQSGSRSVFDDFFGSYETVKKQLVSPPLTVNVKELPSGAPSSFSGAVGRFTVQSTLNKSQLKANEALDYRLTFSGNGNFMLIDAPSISFPPDFEVYDPKQNNNYRTTEAGISGEKSFEYIAIPRYGGTFEIPGVEFSYFDPVTASYKVLKANSYSIEVEKGEVSDDRTLITRSSGTEIRMLGQDIRYIKTGKVRFISPGFLWSASNWFYSIYTIIILITIILAIILINWQKKRSDVIAIRSKQAGKIGQKRLKKANEALKKGNKEDFLNELLMAIWGYLGDKMFIDPSGYRREMVSSHFEKAGLNEEYKQRLFELLDTVEYLRYAPGAQSEELDRILSDTGKLFTDLENNLNRRKKNA